MVREVATATSAKQMVKLTTVVIENSAIGFITIDVRIRKSRGAGFLEAPPILGAQASLPAYIDQSALAGTLQAGMPALPGIFIVSGAVRFEQRLRVVAQVVAPVNPGMAAAADMTFVFDPALLQNLGQVL